MNWWEKIIEVAGAWVVIIVLATMLILFATVVKGETVWTPIDGRTVVGEPTTGQPPVVCQPAGDKVVCW